MKIDQALCQNYLGMSTDFWAETAQTFTKIGQDPAILQYMFHGRFYLQKDNLVTANQILEGFWQYVSLRFPGKEGLALAAFLGCCLEEALQRRREDGIPEPMLQDSFQDFERWAKNYEMSSDQRGIGELPWCLFPFAGRLLQIGRLQYEAAPFYHPFYVYKQCESDTLVILAAHGLGITAAGQIEHTHELPDRAVFQTTLTFDGHCLRGFPCDLTRAIVLDTPITLDLREYTLLLAPQLEMLTLHIPAGAPFQPALVDASLTEAKSFFAQRQKHWPVAACHSWLLDPNLAAFAPPQGNSVHFGTRFAKFPILEPYPSAGKFVFGPKFVWPEWSQAPEDTSLQRALKRYLVQGGEPHDVGGVMLF